MSTSDAYLRELYEKCRSFGTPTLFTGRKALVGFDPERWEEEIAHG